MVFGIHVLHGYPRWRRSQDWRLRLDHVTSVLEYVEQTLDEGATRSTGRARSAEVARDLLRRSHCRVNAICTG
jgi:hypothetical protein